MSELLSGIQTALDPSIFIFIFLGVLLGVVVGAIPGISATVGIAVFLPFTFALDPLAGISLLLGIYNGACYSGAIPAILLRTPGTPASAATVLDGYPMARQGKAGQALTLSLVASVIGGLVSTFLVVFFSPYIAAFALSLGPAEYFALAVMALAIIASLGDGALAKGIISGTLGALIGTVGLDAISGYNRFTFNITGITGGIELIPLLVGLFGAAEALTQIEKMRRGGTFGKIGKFGLQKNMMRGSIGTLAGSTGIGFFIGLLPGIGGDVGGYVAYNETKRFSKKNSVPFGQGEPRGVLAAESANNAAQVGGLVPTLTLGIPGNAAAAVLVGALLIHGIQPGPGLFSGNTQLVYAIYSAMAIGFVLMLIVGAAGTRLWAQLLRVPPRILWPVVLVLSGIGAYAVRTNITDVLVMLVAAVLGYVMVKMRYPVAPLLIGVIVGPLAEENFRLAVMQHTGSITWLFEPFPLVLLALSLGMIVFATVRSVKKKPVIQVAEVEEKPLVDTARSDHSS
ncbi:MAG TPA: tripartite tricarboxylate transporter permease [Enteractinococcus helveticum]|uniref:Tripartite tricarboxylate transporter permease n=1 Tax=Enteractinococcus helveticum TaxID=1837282 RepID=A0A921FNJ7_9MICC|nr:tripartite tricarboxylate transporter permease [Enteractinococcus helveticum]HJF15394.1 tripartite tricarboxylate transporter permease [Enteractinococcus helveticum]